MRSLKVVNVHPKYEDEEKRKEAQLKVYVSIQKMICARERKKECIMYEECALCQTVNR